MDYVQGTPALWPQLASMAGCVWAGRGDAILPRSTEGSAAGFPDVKLGRKRWHSPCRALHIKHWRLHRPAHSHSLGPCQRANPAPAQHPYKAEARAASPAPSKDGSPHTPALKALLLLLSVLSPYPQAALSRGQMRHLRPSSQKSPRPEQLRDTDSQVWQDL